jgi:hypothetical protein
MPSAPSAVFKQYFCGDDKPGNIVYLGHVRRDNSFKNQRQKSNDLEIVIRDELHLKWDYKALHALALLNKEAAYKDLAKYDKLNAAPPVEYETAAEAMLAYFQPFFRNETLPLSYQQGFERTPHSTVPGFPWYVIGQTKKQVMESALFQNWFVNWWNAGCPRSCIWSTALKEEIRPVPKLLENKIRTFIIAPVHHVLACEMLFGIFLDQLMLSWPALGHAIGFDKFHLGWNRLIQRFEKHEYGSAEDVKQWDSSFKLWLLMFCSEFVITLANFKRPQDKIRARNLLAELFESIIMTPDGEVFMKFTGNNTGWWGTAVFNCLGNILITFVLGVRIYCSLEKQRPEEISIDKFIRWFLNEITFCVMGDDKMSTYSELIRQTFTLTDILKVYPDCGFEVESLSTDYCHFRIMPFLGCTTTVYKNYYVPLLDRERMQASLIESNPSIDPPAVLIRVNAILREAFFDRDFREDLLLIREAWIQKWNILYEDDKEWLDALRTCDSVGEIENLYLTFERLWPQGSMNHSTVKRV